MTTEAVAPGVPDPGTVIGDKYRVVRVLGMGGMGCLVEAEHLFLRKNVAIKFLKTDNTFPKLRPSCGVLCFRREFITQELP